MSNRIVRPYWKKQWPQRAPKREKRAQASRTPIMKRLRRDMGRLGNVQPAFGIWEMAET